MSEAPARPSMFDALMPTPATNPQMYASEVRAVAAAMAQAPKQFLVRRKGTAPVGPLSTSFLSRLLRDGGMPTSVEVCEDGAELWLSAGQVPELANAVARAPSQALPGGSVFAPVFKATLDKSGAAAALLQAAATNETGWLTLTRDGSEVHIAFRDGGPTQVVSTDPSLSDEALLLEEQRVNAAQLDAAKSFAATHGMGLLESLVETNAIAPQAVPALQKENAVARLMRVLSWSDGEARFDADFAAGQERNVLQSNVMDVCRDAMADLDDDDLVRAIGDFSTPVGMPAGAATHPLVQQLAPDERSFLQKFTSSQPLQAAIDTESEDDLRRTFFLLTLRLLEQGDAEARAFQQMAHKLLGANDLTLLAANANSTAAQLRAGFESFSTQVQAHIAAHAGHPLADALRARHARLQHRVDDAVALEVLRKANAMGLDADDETVCAALESELLQEHIDKLWGQRAFDDAVVAAQRLQTLLPEDDDAKATLARAEAHAADAPARQKLLATIDAALAKQPEHALWLAAAVAAADDKRTAGYVRRLQAVAPAHPLAAKSSTSRPSAQAVVNEGVELQRGFLVTMGFALGTIGLLWLLSVGLRLGASESAWTGKEWFWWVRRALLIVVAIAGFANAHDGDVKAFFAVKWLRSPKTLAAGVVVGVVSGLLSGYGSTETPLVVLLLLATVHVVAEQMFFIWFVLRTLSRHTKHVLVAVAATALLYGGYHATYFYYFEVIKPTAMVYWLVLFTVGGGLPYALLYARNRTVVPPLVCHLLVQGIAVAKWL